MQLNKQVDFTYLTRCKIAILSDTHDDLDERIIDLIKYCDLAIHAGDIGNRTVLDAIQPKSDHVIAVAGNNDKPYLWEVKDWDIVKNLPEQSELLLPGGKIAIEHGHKHDMQKPLHDDLRAAHMDARLVIYGHTHIQLIDKEHTEQVVVNPGAAGYTRNKGGPSCIILTIDNDCWEFEVFKFT
ncbi:MAG: metallophosphatase family protein [gamma proteobacterium symbiont of Taylorina sp.]|nr:metallophosphatase family protein [gamma proteobacterium symbiont of Taylorina sp.]